VITVLDASSAAVRSETFENFHEFLFKRVGTLPKLSDVQFGDVCIVLFKAKVLPEGKFRVQPVTLIKIGSALQATVVDDEDLFFM
jgi:hypothetical protein